MLGAIESAGYRGELVERAAASQPHPAWNISDLPPELRQLFAQAGVEDKLVLIDVHGPG